MSTYFLHDGSNQKGPFSLDELIQQGIDKNTNVWKEGSPDWVKAEQLEELADHFRKTPPPLYKATPPEFVQEEEEKKKSKLPLIIILVAIVAGIAGYFIWKQNNPTYEPDMPATGDTSFVPQQQAAPVREKTPEELRQELALKEQSSPVEYLSLSGTYRKNLIGETVLEGTITNNATVAVFKDIVVKAGFIAPSGTVVGEKNFTVYVMLGPSQSSPFKVKVSAPKQSSSVSMDVVDAVAVE